MVAFKPRLKNPGKVARELAYCETALADPATDDARRQALTSMAEHRRRVLDQHSRCRRCGKSLTDPISVARRVGPECMTKQGSAA